MYEICEKNYFPWISHIDTDDTVEKKPNFLVRF